MSHKISHARAYSRQVAAGKTTVERSFGLAHRLPSQRLAGNSMDVRAHKVRLEPRQTLTHEGRMQIATSHVKAQQIASRARTAQVGKQIAQVRGTPSHEDQPRDDHGRFASK